LIDTIGPAAVESEEAPEQLAKATWGRLNPKTAKRYYSTLEQAIASRANGFTLLSSEAASVLAVRGVSKTEDGYYWHADSRLKAASDIKMNSVQFGAFLQRIDCPVLICMGDKGLKMTHSAHNDAYSPLLKNLREIEFPGGHHLHMEESARAVAEAINEFWGAEDLKN